MEDIQKIFASQRGAKNSIANQPVKVRKQKLKKLLDAILGSQNLIAEAIYKDFKKSKEETYLTEILPLTVELRSAIRNLNKWTKTRKVSPPLILIGTSGKIVVRPKGNVLIISPWNYPFMLAINPLIAAIAAGNTVMIKPSELTPNTSRVIKAILSIVFDESEIAVIEGGKEVGEFLTSLPFDHIFFTGSKNVGKAIAKSAADNFTPVTLELGGKSPAVIDENADLNIAAKRIVWGKFLNAGQTCIAPDYVLVHENVEKEFLKNCAVYINKMYNPHSGNSSYCGIINENHKNKLKQSIGDALNSGAEYYYGDINKSDSEFIDPIILSNVPENSLIMREEIFGPILPVISYSNLDNALQKLNANPNPLALYIFSQNNSFINHITNSFQAGGVVINDVVLHFTNSNLPFGGVRTSGIGNAHGYYGFRTFSNFVPVLTQRKFSLVELFYPPFNNFKRKLMDLVIRFL